MQYFRLLLPEIFEKVAKDFTFAPIKNLKSKSKMKKLFFVFAVTAFFAACNNDTTSTEAPKDSTATAPATVDSTAKAVDTAAKAVDSAATAVVDSVKK